MFILNKFFQSLKINIKFAQVLPALSSASIKTFQNGVDYLLTNVRASSINAYLHFEM